MPVTNLLGMEPHCGGIGTIDLATGETLWDRPLGQATPMTHSVEGGQSLVIMTGGHHFMKTPVGGKGIASALPGQKGSPPRGLRVAPALGPDAACRFH